MYKKNAPRPNTRSRGGGTNAGDEGLGGGAVADEVVVGGALRLQDGGDAEADEHDDGRAGGDLRVLLQVRNDHVRHGFLLFRHCGERHLYTNKK